MLVRRTGRRPQIVGVAVNNKEAKPPLPSPVADGGGGERSKPEGGFAPGGRSTYRKEVRLTERASTHAITLRRQATPPERLLWSRLKRGQVGGYKFRRQHPLGPYIADFYCHQAAFVVEIDGMTHSGDRKKSDGIRDVWMDERRIGVLRVRAVDVFRDLDNVLSTILRMVEDRLRKE